jgi:hypothetical protein
VPERDISTLRPQPRSRMLGFWQQPRRCHVCVQSRTWRSRLQLPVFRVSGLDFVAKKSSLTISNGRKARRGCTALFGSRLDHHAGETCLLQAATDQCRIVVAVRRASQKARRIVRKNLSESIRHIIRKYTLPFCGERTSAVTTWPRSNACRVSCVPVRPVARRINSRIVRSNIKIAGGSALGCLTMMTRPPGLQIANPYLTRVIELNARNNHSMRRSNSGSG